MLREARPLRRCIGERRKAFDLRGGSAPAPPEVQGIDAWKAACSRRPPRLAPMRGLSTSEVRGGEPSSKSRPRSPSFPASKTKSRKSRVEILPGRATIHFAEGVGRPPRVWFNALGIDATFRQAVRGGVDGLHVVGGQRLHRGLARLEPGQLVHAIVQEQHRRRLLEDAGDQRQVDGFIRRSAGAPPHQIQHALHADATS